MYKLYKITFRLNLKLHMHRISVTKYLFLFNTGRQRRPPGSPDGWPTYGAGWYRLLGHRLRQGGLPGCLHQGHWSPRLDQQGYGELLKRTVCHAMTTTIWRMKNYQNFAHLALVPPIQCDQIARLFFNFCPMSYKICQGLKGCQILNKPSKN